VKLTSLSATNFRNLKNLQVEFGTPVVGFVGENAQGKTNILEAIYLLSVGKSLRVKNDSALVCHETDLFRVVGDFKSSAGEKIELTVACQLRPERTKILQKNGQKKTARDFVGNLPAVIFQPEDLNLILLSPSHRRRYLDILLCQTSRDYLAAKSEYDHAVRQRNALLTSIWKKQASPAQLDFWDEKLVTAGTLIVEKRKEFVTGSAEMLSEKFLAISGTEKVLTAALSGSAISPENYAEELIARRESDIASGQTSYGPHRQDLDLRLENEAVAETGSRGEIRSTVLALKLAELLWLEKIRGEKPLLLLDDVFSELDRGRQERLMQLTGDYQTFITTTKLEHFSSISGEKEILEVKAGEIRKI